MKRLPSPTLAALLPLALLSPPKAQCGLVDAPAKAAATKPPISAPAKSAPSLAGKWRAANGAVFELKPDGTGVNARGPFRWSAEDGELMFTSADGAHWMEYELTRDRLIVTVKNETATFMRAAAKARVTAGAGDAGHDVVVNRARLSDDQVAALESRFHVRILDGAYWYDRRSGAWGTEGGPTIGFIPAGLSLGGPLRADASGGRTGVFINGREIHPIDAAVLQQLLGQLIPGRYWVNSLGLCGHEGNPLAILNLATLVQAERARSAETTHGRNDFTGIGSGGDGRTSYVMGKDWSVIIGE